MPRRVRRRLFTTGKYKAEKRASRRTGAIFKITSTSDDRSRIIPPNDAPEKDDTPPPIEIERNVTEIGIQLFPSVDKSTETTTFAPKTNKMPVKSALLNMVGNNSAQNVNSIVDLLNWLETCGTIIITEDDADLIRSKICRFFSEYKEDPHLYVRSETNEVRMSSVRPIRVTSTQINSRQSRATYKRSDGDHELKNRVNFEKGEDDLNPTDNCALKEFEKVNTEEKSEKLNQDSSFFSLYSEIKDESEDTEKTIAPQEFHTRVDIGTEGRTQENQSSTWVPVWGAPPKVPARADKSHIPNPNTNMNSTRTDSKPTQTLGAKTKYVNGVGCPESPVVSIISLTRTSNPKVYRVKRRPPSQRPTSHFAEKEGKGAESNDSKKADEVLVPEESMANPVISDDSDSGGESNSCNLYSENQDETSDTEPLKEMCLEDYPQELAKSIPLPRGIENPRLPPPDPTVIGPKPLPGSYYLRTLGKLSGRLKSEYVPPFKCKECGEVLRTKWKLKVHKETHLNSRNCLCEICGKSFKKKSNLNVHMRIHIGVKKFLCDKCPKAFLDSSGLARHQRTHIVEKLLKCPVCNKLFGRIDRLREHSIVHSEERPFKCTVCPKTFRRRDHYLAHSRIHTGDKRHKCEPCGKSFVQIGSLIFHNRTHHGIVKEKLN